MEKVKRKKGRPLRGSRITSHYHDVKRLLAVPAEKPRSQFGSHSLKAHGFRLSSMFWKDAAKVENKATKL